MLVKITCVFLVALAVTVTALENFEDDTLNYIFNTYEDCSNSEGFSPCLKKKALTLVNRLGRMDKFSIADSVSITRVGDAPVQEDVSEEQLDHSLPRSADAKDAALTSMLIDKISSFFSSRTLEVTVPKSVTENFEVEGRKKKGGQIIIRVLGAIVGKLVSMIPIAIAGLYALAWKALITAKIALLIISVIGIKKLFHHKHHDEGHGGGYHGGGGGWQRRSAVEAQKMAYNAYT